MFHDVAAAETRRVGCRAAVISHLAHHVTELLVVNPAVAISVNLLQDVLDLTTHIGTSHFLQHTYYMSVSSQGPCDCAYYSQTTCFDWVMNPARPLKVRLHLVASH